MLFQDTTKRGDCLVKLIGIERGHPCVAVKGVEYRVPVSGFMEVFQSNRKCLLTRGNYSEIVVRIRDRQSYFIDVIVSLFARLRRDEDRFGSGNLFLLRQVRKFRKFLILRLVGTHGAVAKFLRNGQLLRSFVFASASEKYATEQIMRAINLVFVSRDIGCNGNRLAQYCLGL